MNRQYYGIKFPFVNNNEQGYLTDVNVTTKEMVRSELIHLILTPRGQRIRKPDFGTRLMQFIYEQNDDVTWAEVEDEIKSCVSKYLPYVTLNSLEVSQDMNDEFAIYVKMQITIAQGSNRINDSVIVQI